MCITVFFLEVMHYITIITGNAKLAHYILITQNIAVITLPLPQAWPTYGNILL